MLAGQLVDIYHQNYLIKIFFNKIFMSFKSRDFLHLEFILANKLFSKFWQFFVRHILTSYINRKQILLLIFIVNFIHFLTFPFLFLKDLYNNFVYKLFSFHFHLQENFYNNFIHIHLFGFYFFHNILFSFLYFSIILHLFNLTRFTYCGNTRYYTLKRKKCLIYCSAHLYKNYPKNT